MHFFKTVIYLIFLLVPGIICHLVLDSNGYKSGALHFGLSYLCLIVIAFTGAIIWYTRKQMWMLGVWVICYAGVFFVAVLSKVIEKYLYAYPINVKLFFYNINKLFVSPLPFFVAFAVLMALEQSKPKAVDKIE